MQVVLTRDADDGAPFARALGPGVDAVFMPVTSVVAAEPADLARLAACAAQIRTYAHLFVASRHAVPPLGAALSAAPDDPATAPPATAVGPATAAALTAAGFRAIARGDTGESAAAALAALGIAGSRILAPRARGGRDEPLDLLRAAGATVDDVVAYQLRPAPPDAPALAAGRRALAAGAAACLVFAPSQAAALAALVAADGGLAALAANRTRFVAIGPTTAAALAAHGAPAAAIAATPTPEAMANALAAVYPDAR